MKKFKNILLTGLIVFLIIDCAILLVTFIPVLYPASSIGASIGKSEKIVRESYMTIIHYMSLFSHKKLSTPAFPMTKNTAFHFYEVKVLMNRLEIAGLLALIGALFLLYKREDYRPFKWASLTTLGIGTLIGGTAYVDFDSAFTVMHHILFNNSYWLMDPDIDPIINIFPESYFVTLGIALFSLIGLGIIISLVIYYRHRYCINTKKSV